VQLDGTLSKFPLRELIEMIVYSSVAGVLELRIGDEVGQLFFDDGRPYHAAIGDCTGFDAICRMFEARDAMFRFVAGPVAGEETLWFDPWEMIERANRQAELWRSVRPRIPNLAWIPALRTAAGADHIHINETTWPVLAAVDGQRSVVEIAEDLGFAPLDVCVALINLLDQGLITMMPARLAPLRPRSLPSQPSAEASRSGPGFLDRMLAQAQAEEEGSRPNLTDETPQDPQADRYINNRYINNR
jgi:Domain of unknown function (DUF4388)